MAYQVCECTRSQPATLAAISRSAAKMRSDGVGAGQPRVVLGVRGRAGAWGAEAVDVDVDEVGQLPGEEVDVDPGAAVDVGRVLPREHR